MATKAEVLTRIRALLGNRGKGLCVTKALTKRDLAAIAATLAEHQRIVAEAYTAGIEQGKRDRRL